jgi:2-oxoglutarate dehydrogenase E2 component (dihydrolipoamide succinyltransferase)
MSTDVVMPQMGESVAEGTIVRWIKKVGDPIDRDEPLFEISTDKVDAEIPSPGEGILLEIKVAEGETVPVNSVVAVIGEAGERAGEPQHLRTPEPQNAGTPEPQNLRTPESQTPATSEPRNSEAPERVRSSPLVRRIAKEHGVDVSQIRGTGLAGRVSKRDILEFIERGGQGAKPAAPSAFGPGEEVRIEKMSVMRKKIADHMVMSVRTSPHVYSVVEVDFHRVEQLRLQKKSAYEQAGTKLTYTAFVAKATVDTIREFPSANASVDGDRIIYKRDVNLGVAVALEGGLIVPVIKDAASRGMVDLCRTIQDLAHRARHKQLKPEDVQAGTFTITNPGVFGALFGLPILNQPQVGILAVGAVEKRVAVVNDMFAIRPMCYLALGHDHRLIDGAEAARFLKALKDRIEHFDPSLL